MKKALVSFTAPTVAAVALAALVATFAFETDSFKTAVVGWATRDLNLRATLAAETLREPVATSDFSRIYAFGDTCERDGMRLTVLGSEGGTLFDTKKRSDPESDAIYVSRPCGAATVRLGLPRERVLAPFRSALRSLVLAGLVGAAGVALVFLVTYRQRVRMRELARLERFRREFVADVSHEIKTPLTGILGAVDLLGDTAQDEGQRRLLEMVKRESGRLNALAQSVLDLARLEREGEALDLSECDAAEIAAEVVEELRPVADKAGAELRLDAPCAGGARLSCDARLVRQALSNLVANAIRHSGSPDIVVRVAPGRREVRLEVEDHGSGIPAEHAARVFERFHRVDPSRAAATGGAGLGLAIVRRIARLHGGDATLESAVPSGCRFVLAIPRA